MIPLQLARKIQICLRIRHTRSPWKSYCCVGGRLGTRVRSSIGLAGSEPMPARSLWSKAVRSQRNSIVTLALTPSPGANNQRPDASSLGYVALTTRRLRPRHCTAKIDDCPTPHWEDPP